MYVTSCKHTNVGMLEAVNVQISLS